MMRMVRPRSLDVVIRPAEPGAGVRVQAEISVDAHERLTLLKMRRRREGKPSRVEDLMLDAIEQFLNAEGSDASEE